MPAAIETVGLTKYYGTHLALDSLDLRVEQGEIFGFLGPNGAGKSTTIRLLLDLIRPTAGRASIMGFDCQAQSMEARRSCGYLAGDFRSYAGITGRATVELIGTLREAHVDWAQVEDVAGRLRLDLERKAGEYSRGNRQKLGLLLAMLGDPPLLLLDEPTSGLDPIVQHEVYRLFQERAAAGTTVFLSSHVMSEVERVCDRVAILRQGRLIAVDEIDDLKARGVRHIDVQFDHAAPSPDEFAIDGVRELSRANGLVTFEVSGEVDSLLKAIARHHVVDIEARQPSLDEVLLRFYETEETR